MNKHQELVWMLSKVSPKFWRGGINKPAANPSKDPKPEAKEMEIKS
jgi:hypothetical protein